MTTDNVITNDVSNFDTSGGFGCFFFGEAIYVPPFPITKI